jgi:hypothetical protein
VTARRVGWRWAWAAVALLPAFLIASYLANASVPLAARLEVLVVLVVTLSRPVLGLMLAAFLGSLGELVVPILGFAALRHAESLVLAFLAGWLSSRAVTDDSTDRMPASVRHAIWVFGAVLFTSVAATALQLQQEDPAALRQTFGVLARSYLLTDDVIGAHTAALLLEGLGLLSATAMIARTVRDRFWLRLTLVSAGVVAGVASGLLAFNIGTETTLARQTLVGTNRYSAIVGDVNATASLYVLLAGITAGMATVFRRTRVAWVAATAVLIVGLALTGSSAGVIAAGLLLWLAFAATSRSKLAAGLLLALAVVIGLTIARTPRATASLDMRAGFTRATMHIIEARPVFGLGIGRYYPMSKLVLPPQLGALYGRENAHDFYLQIVAEVGIVGALAFGWVLAAALSGPVKRAWAGRADALTLGCVGGVLAWLVTALAGHPFLVPEAAISFWIALGLLVSRRAVEPARSPAFGRGAVIAIACALLLTTPFRGGVPRLRLSAAEDGLGPGKVDDAGRPFREAGEYSSVFTSRAVTSVEIPLRITGNNTFQKAHVGVSVPGMLVLDVPVGRDWTTVEVPLKTPEPLMPYKRINMTVTAWDGVGTGGEPPILNVGQIKVLSAQ